MKQYSVFLGKVAAIFVPILALFTLLYFIGYTPLLTSSISFDAKLKYIKEKQIKQTDIIAIGSSMTLNNLSSDVIKDSLSKSYFNFASWGLQINDTYDVTNDYISRYKPKCIIVVSSITDFTNNNLSSSINNYLSTSRYIKDNLEWYFYIKNFNSIGEIRSRKKELAKCEALNNDDYSSLQFDEAGGILLDIPKEKISLKRWNDHLLFPTTYSSSHYKALGRLSALLKNQKIQFIFVQPPIKMQYVTTLVSQQIVDHHFLKCKNIVESYGGIYLNFHGIKEFTKDSLFVDQYHLSSTGAALFTKKITHSLKDIYAHRK